jgi:hypothetical protein
MGGSHVLDMGGGLSGKTKQSIHAGENCIHCFLAQSKNLNLNIPGNQFRINDIKSINFILTGISNRATNALHETQKFEKIEYCMLQDIFRVRSVTFSPIKVCGQFTNDILFAKA